MRRLRAIVAVLALVLALVFLASVACPRRDERRVLPPPEALEGLADRAPASLENTPPQRSTVAEAAAPPELLFRVLDADTGQPLAGAVLELRWEGAAGSCALRYPVDQAGERRVAGLDAQEFTLHAEQEGYLDPGAQPRQRPPDAAPVVLALRAGALLEGQVLAPDGAPVNYGLLTAQAVGRDTSVTVKPGHAGVFVFPALEPGTWRLDWREQVHAAADPRLVREVVLEARRRYRAEIVAPAHAGVAPDPADAPGARPVGTTIQAGAPF